MKLVRPTGDLNYPGKKMDELLPGKGYPICYLIYIILFTYFVV